LGGSGTNRAMFDDGDIASDVERDFYDNG